MKSNDRIIRATGTIAALRFVVVDATETARTISNYHGAKAYAQSVLGETIVASLLLASGLKNAGTLRVTFRFSGDLSQVTSDATPLGLVRARISHDELQNLGEFEPVLLPQTVSVRKLNEKASPIYEGIVEMPTAKIGPSTAFYLAQSEQTRAAVGIHAKVTSKGLEYCVGFLVEAFPDATEKALIIMEQHVRDLLAFDQFQTPDGPFDLSTFLDQLAGPFAYEIHREIPVSPFCPCSESGVKIALTGLDREALIDIVDKGEITELFCEYCRKRYTASITEIQSILDNLKS